MSRGRAGDVFPTVLSVAVFACVGVAAFRGGTEPAGTIFGLPNRTAMIAGWIVFFVVVPAVVSLDIARRDQADWCAAQRSKMAWLALVWTVPFGGTMAYVTLVRGRVVSAHERFGEERDASRRPPGPPGPL